MNSSTIIIQILTVLIISTQFRISANNELPTVTFVDLNRYTGTWYEIARTPNHFQKDCSHTTATYSLDGEKIKVLNQCRLSSGEVNQAHGKAFVIDKESNAKLKVQFFWPFKGDYWIVELGQNYEYAVVGEPHRKYLWILSRTPQMNDENYQAIIKRLPELGYNPSLLISTPQ